MPNLSEILDRMEVLAYGVSGDASVSPLIDSEVTAYTLFPHVAKFVVTERAKKNIGLEDLMTSHSIAMNGFGYGPLPDSVIKDAMKHAYMPASRFASLVSYPDYLRFRYDNQLCYFAVKGSSLYYSCIDDLFASGRWAFVSKPAEGETIVVNGVTFTFRLSGVVVAGAGSAATNGTYTERGTYDEGAGNGPYPYYTLTGQVTPTPTPGAFEYSVFTDGNLWYITDSTGDYMYYGRQASLSGPVCAFPWLCTTWTQLSGSLPVPTVPERTFSAAEIESESATLATADNFAAILNASVNAAISVATYASVSESTVKNPIVEGIYDTTGTAGNAFTMAASSAGAVTVSGSTFTGGSDVVLCTPTVPALPASITSNLTMSQSLIEDIIVCGAAVLRGEIPLARIIEGYMPPTKE